MLKALLETHNVATTALLALYWKHIAKSKENWPEVCQTTGSREKDLFKDDYLKLFINDDVKHEAEQRLDKRMWLPVATRTRFFRRTVSEAVKKQNIQQVIILGSGFDTLPVRKSKYTQNTGVRFFEVDQPELLSCKEAIYKQYDINKNADYIKLDYVKQNLIEALIGHGLDRNQPTLILWEGNTFYLEKTEVEAILRQLAEHFPHIIITFDYMHNTMQTQTQALDQASHEACLENTLSQFKKSQSPFKSFFVPADLVDFCESLGMNCMQHKTAAELAQEYQVDDAPYYTAETYSLMTVGRA